MMPKVSKFPKGCPFFQIAEGRVCFNKSLGACGRWYFLYLMTPHEIYIAALVALDWLGPEPRAVSFEERAEYFEQQVEWENVRDHARYEMDKANAHR